MVVLVSQWEGLWRAVWPQKKPRHWDSTRQRCRCNGTSRLNHTDAFAFSRTHLRTTEYPRYQSNICLMKQLILYRATLPLLRLLYMHFILSHALSLHHTSPANHRPALWLFKKDVKQKVRICFYPRLNTNSGFWLYFNYFYLKLVSNRKHRRVMKWSFKSLCLHQSDQ